MNAAESDNARTPMGASESDPEALRRMLRALAGAGGHHPVSLVEWCSADAPGAAGDLPPLYYAAILPSDPQADMPLGLGDTPAAALTDLLWTLGGSALLAALSSDDLPIASGARARRKSR